MLKLGGTIVALALTASTAAGQFVGGKWQLSPQGSGNPNATKAVIREPQPTVIVVTPQPLFHQPVFPHHVVPRRALTLIHVPAIIMSDGSVFADFGNGFEPVVRSCSGAIVVGPARVIDGRGQVLTSSAAPTYTQPVPAQMTASQQMLSSQSRTVVVSSLAQTSCFSHDQAGRVFIFR